MPSLVTLPDPRLSFLANLQGCYLHWLSPLIASYSLAHHLTQPPRQSNPAGISLSLVPEFLISHTLGFPPTPWATLWFHSFHCHPSNLSPFKKTLQSISYAI